MSNRTKTTTTQCPAIVRLVMAIIIAWSGAPHLLAQNDVTITGVVTDGDGAPIEFATVHVEHQPAGTMTNLKGEYSIGLLKSKFNNEPALSFGVAYAGFFNL